MRLAAISTESGERLALERDGDLLQVDSELSADLAELLRTHGAAVEALVREHSSEEAVSRVSRLAPPVRPGKIVAIGLNYLDHVRESGVEPPSEPLVFAKFPSSVIGPRAPIVIDRALAERVDWEGELAVVIGQRARKVSEPDALGYVFGYTVANDVSARDLQFSDGQWVRGKSLDTFCPLGPVVATASEIGDPQGLALSTKVNGEVVQRSNTREMIFGVAKLISFCSHAFTLEPGDVMLTGTPWGCGEFMDPPRSLRAGDVVEVDLEGIGILTNPVEEA